MSIEVRKRMLDWMIMKKRHFGTKGDGSRLCSTQPLISGQRCGARWGWKQVGGRDRWGVETGGGGDRWSPRSCWTTFLANKLQVQWEKLCQKKNYRVESNRKGNLTSTSDLSTWVFSKYQKNPQDKTDNLEPGVVANTYDPTLRKLKKEDCVCHQYELHNELQTSLGHPTRP